MTQIDGMLEDLTQRISEQINSEVESRVEESIAQVRHMMDYEDQGWIRVLGYGAGDKDREEGPDLDDVKALSEKARTRVALSSLDKRAADLHAGFVFGKGFDIEGTHKSSKAGAPSGLVKFYNDTRNQAAVFSPSARRELQRARFTDGNVFVICNTTDRTAHRVPVSQITAYITDENYSDEVTMWRREWTSYPPGGEAKTEAKWYYSSRVPKEKRDRKAIQEGNKRVPVSRDEVVVDLRANRQVGWALGVPDAAAGMLWAEAYGKVLTYGQTVNESLSKIIFKVTNRTAKGAADAGVKISQAGEYGSAASMADGQDLQMVNTSMRSFDFSAARPLAAMAAAAWNVSNMDLLSDSSAAGSSYGSAQALTDGIRNSMLGMQEQWTEFFDDIFTAVNLEKPDIHWAPLEEPDAYRKAQQLKLLQDALHPEEYREEVLTQLDIPGDPKSLPDTLKTPDVDMSNAAAGVQQASPTQGQNNPAGAAGSTASNDIQNDTIGESMLSAMQMESFLERAEAILRGLSEIENR